jgi:DNA-binding MarR family transcriptional regulator
MRKQTAIMAERLHSSGPASAAHLHRLIEALEEFRILDPEVKVSQVQTVLLVALYEGLSLGELAAKVGIQQSTASRRLIDLSNTARAGNKGLGLVIREPHPEEMRRNQYTLSERGRELLGRFAAKVWG